MKDFFAIFCLAQSTSSQLEDSGSSFSFEIFKFPLRIEGSHHITSHSFADSNPSTIYDSAFIQMLCPTLSL